MTPAQFNRHSISEINAMISACVRNEERAREFLDTLNARKCEVIARCAGNQDAKLADFLILRREPETDTPSVPVMGDTPKQIEEKLKMFTLSVGGTVITRG